MDFIADILAKLDTSQAEAQLKSFKNEKHKIDVELNLTNKNIDISKILNSLDNSFTSAGQDAGKSFSKGIQTGLKSYKFNGDTFLKQYIDQQKKDIKESETVAKKYSTTEQIALKAVRARNTEETKLQKQQQKELDAIENARLRSIENNRKREEKLTLEQNKAINKSLENDYKKQQKEQQKLNDQNLAQIRTSEKSQKHILVQQKIAEIKNRASQKNAHANELVQQGKNNISNWSQQYDKQYRENQKAYFKQVEEYNKRELEYVQKRKEYETQGKKQAQEDADGRALVSAYKDASEYQKRETEYLKLRNQYIAEGKKQEQEYYLEQKKQQKINEQNIAQTRANEESKKRIQAQQQIAELKSNAIQKNAHNNELVQQGKDNIVKWKQQYNESQKDADGLALVEAYKQASEYQQKESEYLKLRNQYLAEGKKQEQEYYSKQQKFSQLDATIASNKTLSWLKNNSKAAKDYGDILTDLAQKQRLATNPEDLRKYTKQVNAIKAEATALGKTGRSAFGEIGNSFKKIGQFVGTYGLIQQIPNAISRSVNELKQMDDILTEISKTSDLTTSQLKELGSTSFDSASKYGKKASDYLTGIQEMSRSGYYGEQAKQMANLSVLAQSAGDIDANMANSYLLASNAAYQYQGNVEKLNALLDGQNMINRMVMPCRKLMAS